MSRAGRARKVAAAAAFGGGGITALTALGVGVITAEVKLARRWIGQPFGQALDANGVYGAGAGAPIDLVVLGDSSAAGLGAEAPELTPGAVVARGLAAVSGRSVRLTSVAVVGAESAHLDAQVDRLLKALRGAGPVAVGACKRLVADVAGREIDAALIARTVEGIADIRASDEGREGVQAFLQKRKPSWLET